MILSEPVNILYTILLMTVTATPMILAFYSFLSINAFKKLLPIAAFPALITSFIIPPDLKVTIPWFFLGGHMGLDQTGSIFLCLSAFIWSLAGLAAADKHFILPGHKRFHCFFLISMSGNFGLIIAQDMLGFYLFFAMMSFATYGLVIADNSSQSRKAGRIYLTLVMISEITLFVALILLAQDFTSFTFKDMNSAKLHPLIILFLYTAFGVKIGALPFHIWMTPSYQNTPSPAASALAGSMINAGILGWLRFMPLGEISNFDGAHFFIAIGTLATFYGVIAGLLTKHTKSILACSTISQMGLMTIIFGLGLLNTFTGKQAATVLILFAVHHSLIKSSLFLGIHTLAPNKAKRFLPSWQIMGLILPGIALAGLPFTSGAIVKTGFKNLTILSSEPWDIFCIWFLPLSSAASTLLALHFIKTFLQNKTSQSVNLTNDHSPSKIPWLLSLVAVILTLWLWPTANPYHVKSLQLLITWHSFWPVAIGFLLFFTCFNENKPKNLFHSKKLFKVITDTKHTFTQLISYFHTKLQSVPKTTHRHSYHLMWLHKSARILRIMEKISGRWTVTGLSYLLLCMLMIYLLL